MNKDLLFMLDNGEEFIKGVYEASEERIYYISVDELNTFEEAGACGTAAVISPIGQIDDVENNISIHNSKRF